MRGGVGMMRGGCVYRPYRDSQRADELGMRSGVIDVVKAVAIVRRVSA